MLTGKGARVAVVASLMLNAFLAGSMVTHFLRVHRTGPHAHPAPRGTGTYRPPGPHGDRGDRGARRGPAEAQLLRDVVQVLGGPRDPRAIAVLAQGREGMSAHRQLMTEAQDDVRQALAAEPYDDVRLAAALAHLREVEERGQKHAQETLVRLGRQLTAQERSLLRRGNAPLPPNAGKD
jgi:uncharacterized membrane protein